MFFAPGCALGVYNPELVEKTFSFLQGEYGDVQMHLNCCKSSVPIEPASQIINVCPGCDRRFREPDKGLHNLSIWEAFAASKNFAFPDYRGAVMSINDACPTKSETRVLGAVRELLGRMNIVLHEPAATGAQAICCGDSAYGKVPVAEVKRLMRQRADSMPAENVVVHCVSCVKAMHNGGKTPRFLLDLLFNQPTHIGTADPDAWNRELSTYREAKVAKGTN